MRHSTGEAVVLLSGGIDSATATAVAVKECAGCRALSFNYGQRNEVELRYASRVARSLGVSDHRVLSIPLAELGGSSLTDQNEEVPRNRNENELSAAIPGTYVPARNTIFLAYALAFAEVTKSDYIYIGVNCVDYSGYPDCRPQFVRAFQKLASLATKRAVEGKPVELRAPLLHMSKAQIVRKGLELGVDYSLTFSCYAPNPEGRACGQCDSCRLRLTGFAEAGVSDPARYADA